MKFFVYIAVKSKNTVRSERQIRKYFCEKIKILIYIIFLFGYLRWVVKSHNFFLLNELMNNE
jgi:hypothetical protein